MRWLVDFEMMIDASRLMLLHCNIKKKRPLISSSSIKEYPQGAEKVLSYALYVRSFLEPR